MDHLQTKVERFWRIFYQYKGYSRVVTGLKNTLIIAISGLTVGILIGTLVAAVEVSPQKKRSVRFLDRLARFYVALFRGTPIVVQLLVTYYVVFPLLSLNFSPLSVCVLVFGLNSGAYVSEIMRSGIQAVDPGQMEAGRAVGLSYRKTMREIIVPQAIKNILPTLGNEFIALIKETSVVSFVGALDLYVAFNFIGTNNYEFMVPYLVMALIYIVLVMAVTGLIRLMERSLRKSDRSNQAGERLR